MVAARGREARTGSLCFSFARGYSPAHTSPNEMNTHISEERERSWGQGGPHQQGPLIRARQTCCPPPLPSALFSFKSNYLVQWHRGRVRLLSWKRGAGEGLKRKLEFSRMQCVYLQGRWTSKCQRGALQVHNESMLRDYVTACIFPEPSPVDRHPGGRLFPPCRVVICVSAFDGSYDRIHSVLLVNCIVT